MKPRLYLLARLAISLVESVENPKVSRRDLM